MKNGKTEGTAADGQDFQTPLFAKSIDIKDFRRMFKNYKQTVKMGCKARDRQGNDRHDQLKWIWFPKETLDLIFDAISNSDPQYVPGVKIYLTVYGKEDRQDETEDHCGLVTAVLVASLYDKVNKTIDDLPLPKQAIFGAAENAGTMSPPNGTKGDLVK